MNEFEKSLSKFFSPQDYEKIRGAHIGIAGAGGLGSNCAANLARCGFRRFTVVDFDEVDYANLNRQFFFADQVGQNKAVALRRNLLMINTDADVAVYDLRLTCDNTAEIFGGCDVIVEAFDDPRCKAMICDVYAGTDKLLVCASGIAGYGRADDIVTRRVNSRLFIVGDFTTDISFAPPLSPRVCVVAAKQADVVLEYILKGTL